MRKIIVALLLSVLVAGCDNTTNSKISENANNGTPVQIKSVIYDTTPKVTGITIVDEIEGFEYGKFVHIMDPDGNKIELWEPIDTVLTQMGGATTK